MRYSTPAGAYEIDSVPSQPQVANGHEYPKLPGLYEQLHRIATLDPDIWRTNTQESFKIRRGATTVKQILDVMRDLGSKNVRSLDIEQMIGLSRGGCLKQLRRMVRDGIVTKNSSCCRQNTWSIHDKFMNENNERNQKMTTNNQNDKKTSLPNGARAKIMRALSEDGMLTSHEISEKTGLTSRQVLDNCSQAKAIGLITTCLDDVTQMPAYRITTNGRKWVEMRNIRYSVGKSDTEPMGAEDETEPAEEVQIDVDVDADAEEPRLLSDEAVDDGVLYAIETSTWNMKITGNNQDAAIAMAIDQAKTTNITHRVFRMEPIGAAMPVTTVQFVNT